MYIYLEGWGDNTFGCQNLKYFPILIVTLMGHWIFLFTLKTQNYHHNSKSSFYISLLLISLITIWTMLYFKKKYQCCWDIFKTLCDDICLDRSNSWRQFCYWTWKQKNCKIWFLVSSVTNLLPDRACWAFWHSESVQNSTKTCNIKWVTICCHQAASVFHLSHSRYIHSRERSGDL